MADNMVTNGKQRGILIAAAAVVLAAAIAIIYVLTIVIPSGHYQKGMDALENERYTEALQEFVAAGSYQDAVERAKEASYCAGCELADVVMDYQSAAAAFAAAGDYMGAELLAEQYRLQAEAFSNAANVWYSDGAAVFISSEGKTMWRMPIGYTEITSEQPEYYTAAGKPRYVEYRSLEGSVHGTDVARIYDENGQLLADLNEYETHLEIDTSEDGQRIFQGIWVEDELFGLADEDGRILAEPQWGYQKNYGIISPDFSEGLAAVSKDGLFGYIDRSGQYVIEPIYGEAYNFSDGVALVSMPDTKQMVNGVYTTVPGGWQVIDPEGNVILKANGWEPYIVKEFRQGWLCVEFDREDPNMGYINKQGQLLMNQLWDSASPVSGRYTDVHPTMYSTTIIDLQADRTLCTLKEDLATSVSFDDERGLIYLSDRLNDGTYQHEILNLQGQQLLKISDDFTAPFIWADDEYLVVSPDADTYAQYHDMGMYRLTGTHERRGLQIISAVQWQHMGGATSPYWVQSPNETNGIISVGLNTLGNWKYGFIDVQGNLVSDVTWKAVRDFNNRAYGFVLSDAGWSMIDAKGKIVISEAWAAFDPYSYHDGLCAAQTKDGLWGYIDEAGQTVIDYQYSRAERFSNGLAIVYFGENPAVIDRTGTIVLEGYQTILRLSDDYYAVRSNGLWQLLNRQFERIA